PDERRHERDAINGASGLCQLQRELEVEHPRVRQRPAVRARLLQRFRVDLTREEPVRLRRVAREPSLKLGRLQPLRLGFEKPSYARPRKRGMFMGKRRSYRVLTPVAGEPRARGWQADRSGGETSEAGKKPSNPGFRAPGRPCRRPRAREPA